MNILVDRKYKKKDYTIGNMYIDGKWFCNTLEDTDRGLDDSMSITDIKKSKIYGQTAIPTGEYEVTLDVISPKFSKYPFYQSSCQGRVPRLLNVKAFDGILIHVADGVRGSQLVEGCLGVGLNKIKGGLLNGKETFEKLYLLMIQAKNKEEKIKINIQ